MGVRIPPAGSLLAHICVMAYHVCGRALLSVSRRGSDPNIGGAGLYRASYVCSWLLFQSSQTLSQRLQRPVVSAIKVYARTPGPPAESVLLIGRLRQARGVVPSCGVRSLCGTSSQEAPRGGHRSYHPAAWRERTGKRGPPASAFATTPRMLLISAKMSSAPAVWTTGKQA
jgi:hypothetical protein